MDRFERQMNEREGILRELPKVIKMSPEDKQKHYQILLKERGQQFVDNLAGAVKRAREKSKELEM